MTEKLKKENGVKRVIESIKATERKAPKAGSKSRNPGEIIPISIPPKK